MNIKKSRPGKMKSWSYKELWSRPGYLVRRLHQIHIGLFAEECAGGDLTPVQFGILSVLYTGEEMDQLTLSTSIGIDRTNGADVIKRLERRALVTRQHSDLDRRAKIIKITEQGRAFVDRMHPAMVRAQEKLVDVLTPDERLQFLSLISKMIEAKNHSSRAPMS